MNDRREILESIRWQRRGSLYVPESWANASDFSQRGPSLPFLAAAVGYSDIFGDQLPLGAILSRIQQLPVQTWIKFVAAVSLVCDRDGYHNAVSNARFANTFAGAGYRDTILAYLDHASYVLFSPHSLASLAKLAIAYAPGTVSQPIADQLEFIFRTYLAVHEHVQAVVLPNINADPRTALLQFLVQNTDFAVHPSLLESFVSVWTLVCEIPREINSPIVPEDIFRVGTSLSLRRFLAMAFATAGRAYLVDVDSPESMVESILISQDTSFSLTTAGGPEAMQFLNQLALAERDTQVFSREDPSSAEYYYDFSVLRQEPLYRIDDGVLIPIYYPFFRWRVTSGLYWDIWFAASSHQQHNLAVSQEQFSQAFGYYFEHYVHQLFAEAISYSPDLGQRIWFEPRDTPQAPAADIVIKYPNAYVFIEIKGARLKYTESMVRGDIKNIEDDLRQMFYEPMCQLAKAITHFQEGSISSQGIQWNSEPIFPVVVTYGSLTYAALRELIVGHECYQKISSLANTLTPQMLDTEEAIRLASLAKNGHGLPDVLRRKQEPEYDAVPFRSYVLDAYGDASEPKHVLEGRWNDFSEMIKDELFGEDQTE